MQSIIILGSTGTIGVQTLEIIRKHPQEFSLIGISCHKNIDLFKHQLKTYQPKYASVTSNIDKYTLKELKNHFPNIIFFDGKNSLNDLISLEVYQLAVVSIVGTPALIPSLEILKKGKDLAIATKEVLVSGGHLVKKYLKESNSKLFPIDSEHVAINLCLKGYKKKEIKNIFLTASGGPFWNTNKDFSSISIDDALAHPNWSMGKKITIDSATMINKGLEVIEAHVLFGIDYDKIKVIIHPQSIIHGMVEYINGAILSQLSFPTMEIPILYALSKGNITKSNANIFSLTGKKLEFFEPNLKKFRGLQLAYEVGKKGGSFPAFFNSANEEAVRLFLDKKCSFQQITEFVEESLSSHSFVNSPSLEEIIDIDKNAKKIVKHLANE
jgi:1-deoxy-D-xylulose-5-phosphate reductoisomerase